MTGKKKYLLMALITTFCINASSQNSQVLYYMSLPQNHLLNPAIRPADRFYIGIPVITGISAEMGNDFMGLSDLLPPGTKIDSSWAQNPNIDFNRLAGKLKDRNSIIADANLQLFGLGMTFGKDLYMFLDVTDRISAKVVFPRDLLELYMTEPAEFRNKTIDLSGMNIKGQFYREYGLGFSKNVTSHFRIGAKAKLLSGIASMSFDNRSFILKVNDDYSQTVTADAAMDISGKATLNRVLNENNIIGNSDSTGKANVKGFILDYLSMPVSNAGVSFDFGAIYTAGKFLSFSASITDLGFINWKHDLKSYKSNSTFNLPGITMKEVVENPDYSVEDVIGALTDTIKNNFKDAVPQSFRTNLPIGLYAGAALRLLPVFSVGVLSGTRLYAGTVKESVTLSGNAYFGRVVTASMSYTVSNYSYNNLGFGLGVKAGVAQFYLIADKIPLDWGKVYIEKGENSGYRSFPVPQNMNLFNFAIGLNISFGKPVSAKTDKPMILVQK